MDAVDNAEIPPSHDTTAFLMGDNTSDCQNCCGNFTNGINGFEDEDCCRIIITINVSGQIYETQLRTLQRFPETLLGHPDKRKRYYDPMKDQYFFDRNRPSFDAILHFYQSGGRLRRPLNVPVDVFADEIQFFQLGVEAMSIYQENEGYVFEADAFSACGASLLNEKNKEVLPTNKYQRAVWLLFEKSDSSTAARIVAIISISVIFLSIICFCLETVPDLNPQMKRMEPDPEPEVFKCCCGNDINSTAEPAVDVTEQPDEPHFTTNPFWIVETVCICWFTVELVSRFLSSPEKKKFCFDCLNIIDLIAIIPYFVTTASLASAAAEDAPAATGQKGISLAFIRVVRLVRVFRIFKLSRHSTGLQILGQTLKSSFRELGLLLFFVLIGVVLFSSAVYFAENTDSNTGKSTYFKSIPDAFWWAIVTMTTVGYGDMHPVTVQGKVVGSVCALTGILCLALPVPVIVSNFMFFYQRDVANKKREQGK